MDSGADLSYVDSEWLRRAHLRDSIRSKLPRFPLKSPMSVLTAANVEVPVSQACAGTLHLDGMHIEVPKAHVMEGLLKGVDLILGMDWLTKQDADLKCGKGVVQLTHNNRRRTLQPKTHDKHVSQPGVAAVKQAGIQPMLTAKKAARALRQGCKSFLVLVQKCEQRAGGTFMCAPKSTRGGSLAAMQDPVVQHGLVPDHVLQHLLEEFQDIFQELPGGMPPNEATGHTIRLEPGAQPPFKRQSRLTRAEEEEVRKQVTDLLGKGFIEPSSSPFGAPVLFVQKKDGTLRMCIDYRALNNITVRDRYPLPNIQDLIDKLHGSTVYSSLDLQQGYHQIRIKPEDVPKTAFITPLGQFQFKVLCFGLTNAPATFQRVMNSIFGQYIGKFVLLYLDDVLVFSKNADEHAQHLRLVFEVLRKHKLYAKLKKCEFNKCELKFLGHMVGREGVRVDPDKMAVVQKWPVPKTVKELQGFLGLANYFRRFVRNYSTIAAPLTSLTQRANADAFNWDKWSEKGPELIAFLELKKALTSAPVLALPDLNSTFEVHTDASVHGTGGVLIQKGRVVAYTSSKFSSAEYNYTTGEQEFLALVRALQVWRCYLEGSPEVLLVTDHHPLVYLQSQSSLSRRQARWMEFLSRFNWKIVYRPGKDNIADGISRTHPLMALMAAVKAPDVKAMMPHTPGQMAGEKHALCSVKVQRTDYGYLLVQTRGQARRAEGLRVPEPAAASPFDTPGDSRPDGGEHGEQAQHMQQGRVPMEVDPEVEKSGNPGHVPDAEPNAKPSISLLEQLVAAYAKDKRFKDAGFTKHFTFNSEKGTWMVGDQVVVPDSPQVKNRIMREMHDGRYAGHSGITKTLERVTRVFYWPDLRDDVKLYVRMCDACQRNKSSAQRKYGLLQPLPVPGFRWASVSCDLIVKLPLSAGRYDAILTFVDRLSKMVHLVPTSEKLSATEFAAIFEREIIRLHGVPEDLVTDRGTQFNNHFWREVMNLLGMEVRMSSAYHPQTDGQTERYNRVIEEMLRAYVSPSQEDWSAHLPAVEFAINNSWQETVKNTPFFLNYGQHPLTPAVKDLPRRVPAAHDFTKGIEHAVREAKRCMAEAHERMRMRENQKRRDVVYQAGDLVMLSTQNLTKHVLDPGARKLKPRFMGPFSVIQPVGSAAVKLAIPKDWSRIHNVFHVSLVKPYLGADKTQIQQEVAPPPVQWLDGEPIYRVEKLLDSRQVKKGRKTVTEYLVRWEGYSSVHDTWEPRSNLLTCGDLVKQFKLERGMELTAEDFDNA